MRQSAKEQDRCHNAGCWRLRFFAGKIPNARRKSHRFRGTRTLWCKGRKSKSPNFEAM